jgi:serine/threonine-protein kinase
MKTTKQLHAAIVAMLSLGACTYIQQPPGDTVGDATASNGSGSIGDGQWGDDGGSDSGDGGGAADCDQTKVDALTMLQTYCAGCHKAGANPPGDFDYVTDVDRLVQEGKVVPGDAASSPLFVRVDSDQMPPPAAGAFPDDGDIATLKRWIDECIDDDPAPAACAPDHRIGIDGMLLAIAGDIADPTAVSQENRPFIRYFTLSHLYDAGLCGDELQPYREALSKTINSLSTGTDIVVPTAIDADGTIFRVDLRDYEWNAQLWSFLASQSPYAIALTREEAADIQSFTGEAIPILRADWLAAVATAPPLYHDLLGLPTTLVDLQVELGVNINADISQEIDNDPDDVARAGFLNSGVSENNRLIERHEIPGAANRALWLSYDFSDNAGEQNLFASPLAFQEAGSEVIFSLPNGLHGYMIVNSAGTRLDEAPDAIVSDPAEPDGNVVNGRSCMGCHDVGINLHDDELREHVTSSLEFDDSTKQAVENLHPEKDVFAALQQQDADHYAWAIDAAGVSSGSEPVGVVFEWYQLDVDLPLAAAEFGITEDELLIRIGGLTGDLQPLAYGTIKRDAFERNFAQAVCDLQLGNTVACP